MKKTLLITGAFLLSGVTLAQTPEKDPYPGYNHNVQPDWSLMNLNRFAKHGSGIGVRNFPNPCEGELPDHWNTADQYYFPPIFGQWGGSCGVASHVGYVVTTEMNAYNNTNAKLPENQLAPNFEYAFTYNGPGKEEMAKQVGFPDSKIYGGRTVSSIYGAYEHKSDDFSWVQGYPIFFNAMHHRITHLTSFPKNVGTPEGMEALKWYLYNHAGDPRFGGRGGVVGIGAGAGSSKNVPIPNTPINREIGVVGKRYMLHWNIGSVDHALCIVGYDDRVQFDLDNNGKVGEEKNEFGENENGAWIIANTWGNWCNNGTTYVPYAQAGPTGAERVSKKTGKKSYYSPGFWAPVVYFYRCGYKPRRTIKATMSYIGRSEISVRVGVAQDLEATHPEKIYQFSYINFTGDGIHGKGSQECSPTPLLGRWADGKMHYEPMEFGIDVTDISAEFDQSKPLKYFLIVASKNSAKGRGGIHKASVIDYEFNENGSEVPFIIEGDSVKIKGHGEQTVITTILPGENMAGPCNLELEENKLVWQAPICAFVPKVYNIYCDNQFVASVKETTYDLKTVHGSYSVQAVYSVNGKEHKSDMSNYVSKKMTYKEAYDNNGLEFMQNGFVVPDVANVVNNEYTIEFWICPKKVIDYNQIIGNSWGSFMIHANADGKLSAGWDLSNRVDVLDVFRPNVWRHVAIVVNNNVLTVYVNGLQKGQIVAHGHNGFPAIGDLVFGNGKTEDKLSAIFDEIRIWNVACRGDMIKKSMKTPVADPTNMPGLLAYLKMDTFEKDGESYVRDYAGGHHAKIMNSDWKAVTIPSRTTLKPRDMRQVYLRLYTPQNVTEQTPVSMELKASVNAYTYKWTAENATPSESSVANPVFVFNKPGKAKVSVEVSDITGQRHNSTSVEVDVQAAPKATADFILSSNGVVGSDPISFVALNRAPSCHYKWSMPTATVEESSTVVATAVYTTAGEKTVTLTVTTPEGEEITSSKTFEVRNTIPTIGYSVTPNVIVKGEQVVLQDESLYTPTDAIWRFISKNNEIGLHGLKNTITPNKSGIYKLDYIASNDMGSAHEVKSNALIVCNANSKRGLMVNGGTKNVQAPLPEFTDKDFSLDYWYNPMSLDENSNGIYLYDDNKQLVVTSGKGGDVEVSFDGSKVNCPKFYIRNEWHHYVIAVSKFGTVKFYRDGEKVESKGLPFSNKDAYKSLKNLQLGAAKDGQATGAGIYDEFRIWNKELKWNTDFSKNDVQQAACQPIEGADLETAKEEGLKLYFPFNQNSGNVFDVVTGKEIGIRSANFGPDGDAWVESKGVFAIDFSEKEYPNVLKMHKLNRSNYRVVKVSDEETQSEVAPVDYAFDEVDGTFWHSAYSKSVIGYPHSVVICRATHDKIEALRTYITREDRYKAKSINIFESDNGKIWNAIGYELYLNKENFLSVKFAKPLTKPYIRVDFTQAMIPSRFLALNELYFYGEEEALPATPLKTNFVSASSQKSTNGAINAIDGNASTYWETKSGKLYPHSIELEIAEDKAFDLVKLAFQGDRGASRMKLYVSTDKKVWTPVTEELRVPLRDETIIRLDAPIKAKYVKVEFTKNKSFRTGGVLAVSELQLLESSDLVNGISDVVLDAEKIQSSDKMIYDLSGRAMGVEIDELPAGIYIRAGEKILIK